MGTVNKAGWKQAKVHKGVTLPSGVVVDITIPNLTQMVATGSLPNNLTDVALRQAAEEKVTPELLKETWEFVKHIVPIMVVAPKVTSDDVEELPIEDLEMLASFATRQADLDAVGHHLGGLETSRSFRELRGLISLDEAMESL